MKLHYDLFHFLNVLSVVSFVSVYVLSFFVVYVVFCIVVFLSFILSFVAVHIAVFVSFFNRLFIIFFCHPSIAILYLPVLIDWIVVRNPNPIYSHSITVPKSFDNDPELFDRYLSAVPELSVVDSGTVRNYSLDICNRLFVVRYRLLLFVVVSDSALIITLKLVVCNARMSFSNEVNVSFDYFC